MRDGLIDDLKVRISVYRLTGNGDASIAHLLEECVEALEEYQMMSWRINNKGAFFSGDDVVDKAKQTDI